MTRIKVAALVTNLTAGNTCKYSRVAIEMKSKWACFGIR
ncbi:Uncharacterised protein [Chlamydia trachomatis]|nr:Uncharacterised protein [Chlamydia trachomatis]